MKFHNYAESLRTPSLENHVLNIKPALEVIDFQDDDFGKKLEQQYQILLDSCDDRSFKKTGPYKHDAAKMIEELTFNRIGLKVYLDMSGILAACLPFLPNEMGSLVQTSDRGKIFESEEYSLYFKDQRQLLEKALIQKGSVDYKKCKVSGIFSEYTNPIWMNIQELKRMGLTAAEITAVYLHEVGHCFTACEYSNRISGKNEVLADLSRKVNNKTKLDNDYIFVQLKKVNPETTKEQIDKIMSGDNLVVNSELFKFLKDTASSQVLNSYYDDNSFETMSDAFASRWGYQKELVDSLQKLGLGSPFLANNSLLACLVISFVTLVSVLGCLTLAIRTLNYGGSMSFIFLPTVILFFISLLVMVSRRMGTMTYDDTKYRYKRIRNQIVELLKDCDHLNKEQIIQQIETIKYLDKIIDDVDNYRNLVGLVIDVLNPNSVKKELDIRLQRLLEELSANQLYIQSASLKTL